MKRTSRLSEETKSSALRFAHLLKSLASFQLSRARERGETKLGGREQPPCKAHIATQSRVPPLPAGLARPLANRGGAGAGDGEGGCLSSCLPP